MNSVKFFKYVIVVFLVLMFLSEALLYIPAISEHISSEAKIEITGDSVSVDQKIISTFSATLGVSYYITNRSVNLSKIYFYFDQSYPTSDSTIGNWYGLSQHINSVLEQRRMNSQLVLLNATQLITFLSDFTTTSFTLIIASGVLPSTVFGQNLNLISPWIKNGGTLLWIGNKIGCLSALSKPNLNGNELTCLGENGTKLIINTTLFGGSGYYYDTPSSNSSAFDINYTYALPGNGVNVKLLNELGGVALGNQLNGYTNVASIPDGGGRILYFSGPLLGDTLVSIAIANILQSNVMHLALVLKQLVLNLTKNVYLTLDSNFSIAAMLGKPDTYFCVFLDQANYLGTFSKLYVIDL
jgi:hypothetical protein